QGSKPTPQIQKTDSVGRRDIGAGFEGNVIRQVMGTIMSNAPKSAKPSFSLLTRGEADFRRGGSIGISSESAATGPSRCLVLTAYRRAGATPNGAQGRAGLIAAESGAVLAGWHGFERLELAVEIGERAIANRA